MEQFKSDYLIQQDDPAKEINHAESIELEEHSNQDQTVMNMQITTHTTTQTSTQETMTQASTQTSNRLDNRLNNTELSLIATALFHEVANKTGQKSDNQKKSLETQKKRSYWKEQRWD